MSLHTQLTGLKFQQLETSTDGQDGFIDRCMFAHPEIISSSGTKYFPFYLETQVNRLLDAILGKI